VTSSRAATLGESLTWSPFPGNGMTYRTTTSELCLYTELGFQVQTGAWRSRSRSGNTIPSGRSDGSSRHARDVKLSTAEHREAWAQINPGYTW
jgi:hypothetical protein